MPLNLLTMPGTYQPRFNTATPDNEIGQILANRASARENDKMRAAQAQQTLVEEQGRMEREQYKASADQAKDLTKARQAWFERFREAARTGDEQAVANLAPEAENLGLKVRIDKRGDYEVADMSGSGLPVKMKGYRKAVVEGGEAPIEFDLDAARSSNMEKAAALGQARVESARPEDSGAEAQQARMNAVLSQWLPLDMLPTKPEDASSRADRESHERVAESAREVALLNAGAARAQRAGEHADSVRLQEEALRIRGEEGERKRIKDDSANRDRWNRAASRSGTELGIPARRKAMEKLSIVSELLKPSVAGDPEAGKAQVIALGELGIMAQGGVGILSNSDREVVNSEMSVLDEYKRKISRGLHGQITGDEMARYELAIERLTDVYESNNKASMEAYVRGIPWNDPAAVEQYTLYMNKMFGDMKWYQDLANRPPPSDVPAEPATPAVEAEDPSALRKELEGAGP